MKLKESTTDQKLRGAYYTPNSLTKFILNWAFAQNFFDKEALTVLEPSCGDGAFLEQLSRMELKQDIKCLGIELSTIEAETARERVFLNSNIEVINDDFFNIYNKKLINQKFDVIIGNPPYIRYQYLTELQRDIQSTILVSNGMKSNKLINAWVSFVVASVQMLSSNGKIGMVIPAELLQVAYAQDLRKYLTRELSKVTIITFNELVFPDVQQEVVVLLGEKTERKVNKKKKITLIEVENLEDLTNNLLLNNIEYKDVEYESDKWTMYFLMNNEIEAVTQIKNSKQFFKFSDIAEVDIGITTGNNKYFSVNKDIVEQYDLADISIPLLGRSSHTYGISFTREDWEKNVQSGVDAHLLYFPNEPLSKLNSNYQKYILFGEENGMNKGYKCSIRENWHHIPSVWVPDAFFLRRNNIFPKFVLNEVDAVSTDTMHRIRFKNSVYGKKAVLSYYNSISLASTELEGRSYGGGVLEILPGELESVLLPNLENLTEDKTEEYLKILDELLRKNADAEDILNVMDELILVEHLKIDKSTVKVFREIWKKLSKRRLNRGKTVK